jgi:hypothetical protein
MEGVGGQGAEENIWTRREDIMKRFIKCTLTRILLG